MINVANTISIVRVFLGLFNVFLLSIPSQKARWFAFILAIFIIYADALDGYFARKLKQTSQFGAVLDIACDRVVEIIFWVAFAVWNWIPLWVPLLFVVRGNLVDAVRAFYGERGLTAFGEHTMMQSKIGKFLVASNFSRFSYASTKALAFALLIAAHTDIGARLSLDVPAYFCVYFACVFCVIRGLPVLVEARKLFVEM